MDSWSLVELLLFDAFACFFAFLPSCLIGLLVAWLALCVVIFFGTCDVLTPFVLEDAR